MKQSIILGNIITMDEKRPFAKAALVKNGIFAYIGSAEEAKKLAGADAQVLDYGDNYIYPGFMESHCHSYLAGDRAIGQANLAQVGLTDYPKYREIIKEFIKQNPQREFYLASGWVENDEYVSKAFLDEICADNRCLCKPAADIPCFSIPRRWSGPASMQPTPREWAMNWCMLTKAANRTVTSVRPLYSKCTPSCPLPLRMLRTICSLGRT